MDKTKIKEAMTLLKEAFGVSSENFGTVELNDGTMLQFEGEQKDLKEGVALRAKDQDGENPVKDGTFTMKSGKKFQIKGGKFVKFVEDEEEKDTKKEEMAAQIAPLRADLTKDINEKFSELKNLLTEKENAQKEAFNALTLALEDEPVKAAKKTVITTDEPKQAWQLVLEREAK